MGATFSSVVEAWTTRATGVQGCDEKKPVRSGDEKTSWPELVGSNDVDASFRIVQDRPEVRVYFYNCCCYKNAPPTDFNPKRVNLFSDSSNRVLTVPKIG